MIPALVFLTPPDDFHSTVEVSGCYCEFENKILFLKRHPQKPQGGTWGVPAGKLELGESPEAAMIRELFEETGLKTTLKGIEELGRLYVRHPHLDFVYHMFYKRFEVCPELLLGLEEHLEARWVTFEEALALPLISGGADALYHYRKILSEKKLPRDNMKNHY